MCLDFPTTACALHLFMRLLLVVCLFPKFCAGRRFLHDTQFLLGTVPLPSYLPFLANTWYSFLVFTALFIRSQPMEWTTPKHEEVDLNCEVSSYANAEL